MWDGVTVSPRLITTFAGACALYQLCFACYDNNNCRDAIRFLTLLMTHKILNITRRALRCH